MYRNPVIVQISDLHFGRHALLPWRSAVREEAKEALRTAILGVEPRPDFLVVTGDLSNCGSPKEMQQARDYLESLLADLWARGQATRCMALCSCSTTTLLRLLFMSLGNVYKL